MINGVRKEKGENLTFCKAYVDIIYINVCGEINKEKILW